ncbi:MAG: hypothetical protein H6Q69_706 [Firmicutes bacterium]|nr:hypothetical protein [Bacillota bacterium]
MNSRIEYIDIAKALGIIFVVIGHAGLGGIGKFIYLFHMPLFFLISGYFFQDNYTLNFSKFITKRIKSLYIPFIKFELIFLVLHNVFVNYNIYSTNPNVNGVQSFYTLSDYIHHALSIFIFNGTELLLAPLWFLTVLFTANIIFWVISKISVKYGENYRLVLLLLCFCLGNLFTKFKIGIINSMVFVPEFINVSLVVVFIFYLGYLYRQHENKINLNSKPLLIASTLILLLLREYSEMDMRRNFYTDPAMLLIGTLFGTYFTFYIAKHISNPRAKNILKYIGNNTVPIMALHLLSFKLVTLIQIALLDLPLYTLGNYGTIGKNWVGVFYTLAGVGLPLLAVYVKNSLWNTKSK